MPPFVEYINIVLSSADEFAGMEQTIFSCLGKPIFLKSNNFGTQYARLNGRVINKNGTDSNRCAVSIL